MQGLLSVIAGHPLTLHADDSLAGVELDALVGNNLLDTRSNERVQLSAEGVAEHRVHDNTLATEKGVLTDTLGAVDDLVGDDKVSWCNLLAKGADGREGNDGSHTQRLEGSDVGAGWDLCGGDGVVWAVTADEGDLGSGWQGRDGDGRRWLAPWLWLAR